MRLSEEMNAAIVNMANESIKYCFHCGKALSKIKNSEYNSWCSDCKLVCVSVEIGDTITSSWKCYDD